MAVSSQQHLLRTSIARTDRSCRHSARLSPTRTRLGGRSTLDRPGVRTYYEEFLSTCAPEEQCLGMVACAASFQAQNPAMPRRDQLRA
jgi:hypothetical protein